MFDLHLTEEQRVVRAAVRDFVSRELAPIALERDGVAAFGERLPWGVLEQASQMGLRTLRLSEALGGAGADSLTSCLVIEELAVGDVGVAATLGQTSALAHALFDEAMTPAQRDRFLPDFLGDDRYHLATAGHEPDTDLGWSYLRPRSADAGYKTTAVRDRNGDWVLNGVKNFITNASIAKLIVVHVRTPEEPGGTGMTSLLVPNPTPGLTVEEHDKVGRRLGSNGELAFDGCRVPAEHVLGDVGRSPFSRSTAGRQTPRFQAMNLGVGRAAYEEALAYVGMRVQGGRPIVEHQAVGLTLADMAMRLESARALTWQAAWASDHPEAYADGSLPDLPLQLVAKVVVAEAVQQVALDAAQLFGGSGVMSDMPAQKYVRDALVFLHSETTNDVARLRIAEHIAAGLAGGTG